MAGEWKRVGQAAMWRWHCWGPCSGWGTTRCWELPIVPRRIAETSCTCYSNECTGVHVCVSVYRTVYACAWCVLRACVHVRLCAHVRICDPGTLCMHLCTHPCVYQSACMCVHALTLRPSPASHQISRHHCLCQRLAERPHGHYLQRPLCQPRCLRRGPRQLLAAAHAGKRGERGQGHRPLPLPCAHRYCGKQLEAVHSPAMDAWDLLREHRVNRPLQTCQAMERQDVCHWCSFRPCNCLEGLPVARREVAPPCCTPQFCSGIR